MTSAEALWTAGAFSVGTALAVHTALAIHTRLRGWLPEDAPTPTGRKKHTRVTPLVGFVPGLTTAAVLWVYSPFTWLAGAVVLATAVGLFDDLQKTGARDGMRWQWKGVGLLLAAALGAWSIATAHGTDPAVDVDWLTLATLVAALFVAANAVNFLDNADGVAALTASVGLAFLWWTGDADTTRVALLCAGVWLGFLTINWPRTRAFLGDGGALPLGLALGALACQAALQPAALTSAVDGLTIAWDRAFLPAALFYADFIQVVVARLIIGRPPWVGDRRHLTHIAEYLGVPNRLLAPLFAGTTAAILAVAL